MVLVYVAGIRYYIKKGSKILYLLEQANCVIRKVCSLLYVLINTMLIYAYTNLRRLKNIYNSSLFSIIVI